MTALRKRTMLVRLADRRSMHLLRGFYAPQRDHAQKVQHPKPARGQS